MSKKAAKSSKKGIISAEDEEDDEDRKARSGPISKGWRRYEFYGGEGGIDSDVESDEEMMMEEARRLEDLRANRLKGTDPLAALLGDGNSTTAAEQAEATETQAVDVSTAAKFEAVFAADAEYGSTPRDINQLSEAKKRSLLKSEAPELVPLLSDFKAKLQGLRELLPLVTPQALALMSASGASYLRARCGLLLSTLANLAYYLLVRAEGGAVRSHPVVTQLVWLRELHEQFAPLDKELAPRLQKAIRELKKISKLEAAAVKAQRATANGSEGATNNNDATEKELEPVPRKRLTLRERFEKLRPLVVSERPAAAADGMAAAPDAAASKAAKSRASTDDLLRLPKSGKKQGADGVPTDLDDVDPLVGAWRPSSTLTEQLSSVQQHLGERAAAARPQSADQLVEARVRRRAERPQEEPLPDALVDGSKGPPDEGDERIQKALSATQKRKERKAKEEAARMAELAASQYQPDKVLDGRRRINKRIQQNRGLVRQRPKDSGHARIANRKKYKKMMNKRKSTVQEMLEGAADGARYEGEATGIRTKLKKSTRLG